MTTSRLIRLLGTSSSSSSTVIRRVERQPTSRMRPQYFPKLTHSPASNGCSACRVRPAKRLPSVSCSAKPSTTESSALVANSDDRSSLYSTRSSTAAQRKVIAQTPSERRMRGIPTRPRQRMKAKASESPSRSTAMMPKNREAVSIPCATAGWNSFCQKNPASLATRYKNSNRCGAPSSSKNCLTARFTRRVLNARRRRPTKRNRASAVRKPVSDCSCATRASSPANGTQSKKSPGVVKQALDRTRIALLPSPA